MMEDFQNQPVSSQSNLNQPPQQKPKKHIPTWLGLVVIIATAVLLFGGAFALEYYLNNNFKGTVSTEKNSDNSKTLGVFLHAYPKNSKEYYSYFNDVYIYDFETGNKELFSSFGPKEVECMEFKNNKIVYSKICNNYDKRSSWQHPDSKEIFIKDLVLKDESTISLKDVYYHNFSVDGKQLFYTKFNTITKKSNLYEYDLISHDSKLIVKDFDGFIHFAYGFAENLFFSAEDNLFQLKGNKSSLFYQFGKDKTWDRITYNISPDLSTILVYKALFGDGDFRAMQTDICKTSDRVCTKFSDDFEYGSFLDNGKFVLTYDNGPGEKDTYSYLNLETKKIENIFSSEEGEHIDAKVPDQNKFLIQKRGYFQVPTSPNTGCADGDTEYFIEPALNKNDFKFLIKSKGGQQGWEGSCENYSVSFLGWLTTGLEDTKVGDKIKTADWKTYKDDKYGFEVKYPNDWIFKNEQGWETVNDYFFFEKSGYTLSISNRSLGYYGLINKDDLKNYDALSISGISFLRSKKPEILWNNNSYFNLLVKYPNEDPGGTFVWQYDQLLKTSPDSGFGFQYVLPEGITESNYDPNIISEMDKIVETFNLKNKETWNGDRWEFYKNEIMDFSIFYPVNLTPEESQTSTVTSVRFFERKPSLQNSNFEVWNGVINYAGEQKPLTFKEFVDSKRDGFKKDSLIKDLSEKQIAVDGVPAIEFSFIRKGPKWDQQQYQIFMQKEGINYYAITMWRDMYPSEGIPFERFFLDSILPSFKFVKL
jgi:hypothetical protein